MTGMVDPSQLIFNPYVFTFSALMAAGSLQKGPKQLQYGKDSSIVLVLQGLIVKPGTLYGK